MLFSIEVFKIDRSLLLNIIIRFFYKVKSIESIKLESLEIELISLSRREILIYIRSLINITR